jgi:hypothetical protein
MGRKEAAWQERGSALRGKETGSSVVEGGGRARRAAGGVGSVACVCMSADDLAHAPWLSTVGAHKRYEMTAAGCHCTLGT